MGVKLCLCSKLSTIVTSCSASQASIHDSILEELSWPVKLKLLNDFSVSSPADKVREVGMEALTLSRRQNPSLGATSPPDIQKDDETNMRMKLFRLMYETVRDSDLKVKRAELIRGHYTNSTAFEIGYLLGDVTDKFNIMSDVSMTLTRLYHEWKPIEHINAYEQIANQAIEISHLIDMVRHISKKGNYTL